MKLTLRIQYIIAFFVLVLSVFLLLNTYGYKLMYKHLESQKQDQLYQEATFLASHYAVTNGKADDGVLSLEKQGSLFNSLLHTDIWLADSTGKIRIDTSSKGYTGKSIPEFDSDFLNNTFTTGVHPNGIVSEAKLSVVYPLTVSKETRGYLILLTPMELIQNQAKEYIDMLLTCYLLLLALVGIILLFLYRRSVTPLWKIGQNAKEYTNGNFDVSPAPVYGAEQLALVSSLKYMAEKTLSMSTYQKQFLANVSHDFRSPLTSIRGYADALSDGTIPPEMQEKYLKIIVFETERLTKLTSNLLDLNQFESNGLIVELERMDLHETIKETISSFERRCEQKKITLELSLDGKELYVDADKSKIQRVIQNLVDNAIKFSHPDSVIEIHTEKKHHKAFVSVKDHGIGITKEDAGKIWDRFYKSDHSRGKDKTGTGLGLSITKELVEAHGEHINVISTEGVGTEFIFSLPLSS